MNGEWIFYVTDTSVSHWSPELDNWITQENDITWDESYIIGSSR